MLYRKILYMTILLVSGSLGAKALLRTPPMQGGKVHKLTTMAQYTAAFNSQKPMIIMCSSISCGPCKVMKPTFHRTAALHPDIHFCLIDTDNKEFEDMLNEQDVRSIPHLLFSHNGKSVFSQTGGVGMKTLGQWVTNFRYEMKKLSTPDTKKDKKSPAKKTTQKAVKKTPQKTVTKKK